MCGKLLDVHRIAVCSVLFDVWQRVACAANYGTCCKLFNVEVEYVETSSVAPCIPPGQPHSCNGAIANWRKGEQTIKLVGAVWA